MIDNKQNNEIMEETIRLSKFGIPHPNRQFCRQCERDFFISEKIRTGLVFMTQTDYGKSGYDYWICSKECLIRMDGKEECDCSPQTSNKIVPNPEHMKYIMKS